MFCSFCCSQGFRENKVVCYATVSWKEHCVTTQRTAVKQKTWDSAR